MHIGNNSQINKLSVLWPHKVFIGASCSLEPNIVFTYNGSWTTSYSIKIKNNVFIGRNCEFNIRHGITIQANSNISSGCKFIDHNHGMKIGELIGPQSGSGKEIIIEEDVWLGVNVVVLEGVIVGSGAVIGAGAVVTKSIPENEIWAGIPAKKVGERK